LFLFIFSFPDQEDQILTAANNLGRVYYLIGASAYKPIHVPLLQHFLIQSCSNTEYKVKSQKSFELRKKIIDILLTVGVLSILKATDGGSIKRLFAQFNVNQTNEKNLLVEMKDQLSNLKNYQ
jgi:hypothetical protein